MSVTGSVTGGTFANADNSFSVDADGDVTAKNVTASGALKGDSAAITNDATVGGKLSVTGSVTGGTFANADNSFSVDADGDVTAKDVTASGVLKGDSAAITNDATVGGKLSVTGSVTGGTFANTNNSFSVDADGNVTAVDFTAGSVKVDGTANTVTGLSNTKWDDSTIQSVTNDTDRTGAAAYAATQGQLYDVYNAAVENAKGTQYTAGDGIAIGTGDTPAISVNYGAGLELGEAAGEGTEPLQVNANEKKGIEVTDADGVGVKLAASGSNLTFDTNGGLTLADTLTGLTSINAGSGSFTSKLTVGSGASNISIENGTISGLADITAESSGDVAVNKDYVDKYVNSKIDGITVEGTEYTQGDGVSIAKGAGEGDPSTISVNAGDGLTFADSAESGETKKLVVNAGKGLDINAANGSVEVQTGSGLKVNEDTNAVELVVDNTNLQVDETKGLGLKPNITVTSATASTFAIANSSVALSSSGLTVSDTTSLTTTDGLKATKATIDNISIDGNAITGVTTNAQEGTSAVSVDYLKGYVTDNATYTAGNGLTLNGKEFSVKTGAGLGIDEGSKTVIVKKADNSLSVTDAGVAVNVDENANLVVGDNGLDLKDAITLNKVTASQGFYVGNDGPQLTTSGLTIGNTVLTNGSLYIDDIDTSDGDNPITISNGGITGLVNPDGTDTSAAVNVGYLNQYFDKEKGLAVLYDSDKRDSITLHDTTISGLKATDSLTENSTYAATVGQVYTVDQKVGDLDWGRDPNVLREEDTDLTNAVLTLDGAIGDLKFTSGHFFDATTNTSDLTEAIDSLNMGIGKLQFSGDFKLSNSKMTVTDALRVLDEAVGTLDWEQYSTPYLGSDVTTLTMANVQLAKVIKGISDSIGIRTEDGSIEWGDDFLYHGDTLLTTLRNWSQNIYGDNGNSKIVWGDTKVISEGASIVSGMKELDTKVGELEGKVNSMATVSDVESKQATTDNKESVATESPLEQANSIESPVNTEVDEASVVPTNDTLRAMPALMSANMPVSPYTGEGDVESGGSNGSRTPEHWGNITSEEGKTTIDGNLTVNGDTTMNGSLNMTNHTITGVADGKISADSTDAINGSQLYDTNQRVAANEQNIGILGSAVNKLGDRIERVGAGAAALAALHPLDFDPDNKLDFAAGFGNYRGASAVAVGAFYRPSENVMFSVGGAFGGGEDMVNAGVSFKVGAGSGSATTSRTAMAKSLKSMQEVVASQDAQLAQQREQIDKLTAMVELLMEQNGQAQPKDGDAQAGQPQQ